VGALGHYAPAVQALNAAVYRHEAASVYGLLQNGATLADGQPLWDSSNSVTGLNVLSVFEQGFELFAEAKLQTGDPLDVDPAFLVIPPSWSLAASDIISDLILNVGRLQVIKSAHVTSGYLLADPAIQPVIGIMAMANAQPAIELDNSARKNFEGMSIKVSHSYKELALSRVGAIKMTITS
jgi:phage major head subunit gpT-like protein